MVKRLVKPLNFLLAGFAYLKSSASKQVSVYGMPPAIGIELTNNCNLRCPECASGSGKMKRSKGYMEIELFVRLIDELSPYLYNVNLYFQGEPMLHPEFSSFIRYSGNIRSVISTNGHYLTTENCDKIVASGLGKLIISVDGPDQASYSAYRINGDIEAVMEGIRNMVDTRKKFRSSLKIEIQMLVNKLNEHQIPLMRKMASNLGVALKLKSMQIISNDTYNFWLPSVGKFNRYSISEGRYVIKGPLPDRCARLWLNPVVTWDGKVLPCCFDKDADHIMGDLQQESFSEIWNGTKFRLFRRMLLSDRGSVSICNNCTAGLNGVEY